MTPLMPLNLEPLATTSWASYAQPPASRPNAISDAIYRLAAASTADEAALAYNAFLFAVGNNHAGTYFPVVIDTLPFLEKIIRDGSVVARNATLDALIDLVGSFEPDPAFQSIATGLDEKRLVRDVLRERVAALDDLITRFALDLSAERETRERAGALLDLIRIGARVDEARLP
jgi:hypothetical protein